MQNNTVLSLERFNESPRMASNEVISRNLNQDSLVPEKMISQETTIQAIQAKSSIEDTGIR